MKEKHSKNNFDKAFSSSISKITSILLIEVIAFHVRFFAVYILETGFQGLVLGLFGDNKSSNLQNGLENLLQIVFGILGDRRCGDKDNNNKYVCF